MNDDDRKRSAEMLERHMARIPEIRALYEKRSAGQAALSDLLTLALWETWDAIYSLPPSTPDNGRRDDPWHAGAAAFRATSSLIQAQRRIAEEPTSSNVDVCGKRCDHGSECLLLADHAPPDRHETQHGCIFYDEEKR